MTRLLPFIAISFLGIAVYSLWADDPPKPEAPAKRKPTFTIGKETTFVTGPVDEDGYIDYAAALNKKLSEGVTPENNAVVLLVQAMGPRPEGVTVSPEFYKWLGIDEPPENGEYFVQLKQAPMNAGNSAETDKLYEQLELAKKRPWTVREYPDLAAWLVKNEKPLRLITEASRRPRYFYPLVPKRTERGREGLLASPLPHLQGCRSVTNAIIARAMLALGEGKIAEAWKDLLAVHRLARLIGQGGTLIEGLVGCAIDGIVSVADLQFLEAHGLEANTLHQCLQDLQSLTPTTTTADRMNFAERFTLLEIIMQVDKHGLGYMEILAGGKSMEMSLLAKLFYANITWNSAFLNANAWYDKVAAAMRLTSPKERRARLGKLEEDLVELKKTILNLSPADALRVLVSGDAKGTAIGDILICLLAPAFPKVQTAADRNEETHHNLHLAFALAIYHREHSRYPEKLDSLAPKYLPEIPKDVFSGESIIYKPDANGYLLYSVGLNGVDDGGKFYGAEPPGDDVGFRMPPSNDKKNQPVDGK